MLYLIDRIRELLTSYNTLVRTHHRPISLFWIGVLGDLYFLDIRFLPSPFHFCLRYSDYEHKHAYHGKQAGRD